MDSIIINGDEPKLLQLVVWFDGKFVNNSVVTVQIGSSMFHMLFRSTPHQQELLSFD